MNSGPPAAWQRFAATRSARRHAPVVRGHGPPLGGSRQTAHRRGRSNRAYAGRVGVSVAIGAFNKDGTRYIGSSGGALAIYDAANRRDGRSGHDIGPRALSRLVVGRQHDRVRAALGALLARCVGFGQQDIFVYGGSIVTMQWNGTTFANEQVVVPPGGGFNNFYPSFLTRRHPDRVPARASTSGCIELVRGGHRVQRSQNGDGVSYDNPSSSIWSHRLVSSRSASTPRTTVRR